MKIKTKLWSVGNGEWIIHIRKSLKKRFEESFKTMIPSTDYYDNGKLAAVDYKFDKEKYLVDIKKWLRTFDK